MSSSSKFSVKTLVFSAFALSAALAHAEGYVLGLGLDVDTADGRALSVFGDFGVAENSWLSGTVSASQVEGNTETRETTFADVGFDHWFKPVGIRVGASYWGNSDILDSTDYSAALYFRGDSSMLSFNYQRREFDFVVLADFVNLRRTAEFSANGIGLTGRIPLGEKADFHFGGMSFNYSRNIRIQPDINVLRFLSASRLSMINSLIDHRVNVGVEFEFGLRSLDVGVTSWQTAVDGGRVDSYGIGFLTPMSDRTDIEFRLSFDDSESFGQATAFSVYLYFFGGT